MKTLIVYYSWHNGNTKRIAEMIQKKTGYKPANKKLPYDVNAYERIIIGTPTWWYTMAPAVLSFLDAHDLTGKPVVPFMTNAGWPGTVIKDMCAHAKGAKIEHAREILFHSDGGDTLMTSEDEINAWIEQLAC